MKTYWMGLDIGGTKCAMLLARVDRGIHILDKIRFATQSELGFDSTYERLLEAMDEMVQRNGIDFTQVEAIGISCGGPLDSRRGMVLCPPNLPGWVNIPLCEMLEKRYHVPAFLQNDANACALVEWKLGAGRGTSDMIFLTMGTGMGAGVIAEGRLLRGCTDMGGEVGHLRLAEDGPVGFGKAGSFEGYTSGGGIQRQALTRELIEQGNPPQWIADGHTIDEVDGKLMADYARAGNAQAITFYDHIGTMLGRGLSLLTDAFNPEKIVIGSIFVRCEDLLRPAMAKAMQEECIPFALEGVSVVAAQTGESLGDLASIMAALYALDIDPITETSEQDEAVLRYYERLFERYPQLERCRQQVMEAYLLLRCCYDNGGKVLIAGNGGSCADSEHIAGELMKGFYLKRPLDAQTKVAIQSQGMPPEMADRLQQGLPAIALTGHSALSTAVANDQHALLPMAQQVMGYGRKGDVLIAISTSGNAQNAALAVSAAKGLGLKVIGLTGETGGKLAPLCDCAVNVPAESPADVQELHLPVYHTLCAMLEARYFKA
ncbi:MAG: ROK family protein [Clostridia bacterium]|nr:ROK family protein [Clostridia bacterium]